MSRSLRVAPHQIERVKLAYQHSGYPSQQGLATELGKSADTIRKFFSGKKIDRLNFIEVCEKLGLEWQEIVELECSSQENQPDLSTQADVSRLDPNFVGREGAIADLDTLVNRGAKVIVIQARGGVGKTTLARKYLQQEFRSFIEFPIAKETKDIASIEALVEEKLRQLGEEPGREFLVSIDRLKRKLQAERIGILIDNLEPALDASGKFIEPHRRYVELLRVLADPLVQSVTLITSREHLRESSVTVQHYSLQGLDTAAWEQFFQTRHISVPLSKIDGQEQSALVALHHAYGGNAKAMDIISGVILEDFSGSVEAYWQTNQTDLLIERDLEDLVTNQFDRLQQLDPDAYKLLCRMGCYRYQDVPTVPIEGLFCLLWDVPENRHRRVIKSLQDRSLVDFENKEFWLHPVIRAEAIGQLRLILDWEKSHNTAANFWTESIRTVEITEDAIAALEAYYHHIEIYDFDAACRIITKERKNICFRQANILDGESLARSFYRLGILNSVIFNINYLVKNKDRISPGYHLSSLYNILGDFCGSIGYLRKSIELHKISGHMAKDVLDSELDKICKIKLFRLIFISPFNIAISKISLGEFEEAMALVSKKIERIETEKFIDLILDEINLTVSIEEEIDRLAIEELLDEHEIDRSYCLAFIKSSLACHEEALDLAEYVYSQLDEIRDIWSQGYSLLFLGNAYSNLNQFEKASNLYNSAVLYSEGSSFPEVGAKARNGLARIHYMKGDFEEALSKYLEAVELLKNIGAECELAEVYYQLALTYQAINEDEESYKNFQAAIQLFSEMEAPKQVERVRQSMQSSN